MARGRRTAASLGLVLLLIASVWGVYLLFDRMAEMGPSLEANQLLLPVISMTLVVLALALAGVLIRNLVRLIMDRKRGILGSRLRTKLVFFFLALVLLPAAVLFSGSAQVIKKTVEAIVRAPIDELTRQSRQIVEQWNDYFRNESLRRATDIAEAIQQRGYLEPLDEPALSALVRQWQGQTDSQMVWVTSGERILSEAVGVSDADAALGEELRARMTEFVQRMAAQREPMATIDYLSEGLLALAAVPVRNMATPSGDYAVAVAIVIPAGLAENIAGIDAADQAYRRFRAQRRVLVRLYVNLIALIFLVTIFIATWIGFYLSRRITVPIQELASASREISAGNLGVRVSTEVGDEIGVLVDAFNEMAGQLQENREVITRSTADLRRTNRALDERRRYIEQLLANISTAVISLDTHGQVTTANPAAKEILGVQLSPGNSASEAFEAQGLEPLSKLLDQTRPTGTETSRSDLSLAGPNGPINVSVQVSALGGSGGEPLGTLVMVEDLTELLRGQKAAAWREIARRIAHEIKNPLTPIQLAAQRLRKKFSEGAKDLDTVVPAATASIEREVGALKRLVDEFSKFARMPEVDPRKVDFSTVVESVLALYKGLPAMRWEVELDPDLGPVVVDPEQMRRVLINLIDNAVGAMEGQGTLGIRVRAPMGQGLMRIEVSDTGPGIPVEDRDKMFSPYFSTKQRGTGLGLAIVQRVVTDHQGTIRVDEGFEQGARFVIEIPI